MNFKHLISKTEAACMKSKAACQKIIVLAVLSAVCGLAIVAVVAHHFGAAPAMVVMLFTSFWSIMAYFLGLIAFAALRTEWNENDDSN